MNIVIYNGSNSQEITISGLADDTGALVSTAKITGSITRAGVALAGSGLTFTATDVDGSYSALLYGFDAPAGAALLVLTGTAESAGFTINIFCTIAVRQM